MKSFYQPFYRRVATCLTAVAAVAAVGMTTNSNAAVVYVDPPDISVPNTIEGVYLDLVTGAVATNYSQADGYDVCVYGRSDGLNFYFENSDPDFNGLQNAGVTLNGTTYAALTLGSVVGPNSQFLATTVFGSNANYTSGTSKYLGLEFTTPSGNIDYGYVHIGLTNGGFPAAILDYAYENTGSAILVGAVPEPGTNAVLAIMSLGAVGLRAWQRRKQNV